MLEHYQHPKNKGLIDNPSYINVHLKNPSCGDDMKVCCKIDNDIVTDIRHDGHGCSICCSSASVMSELLKGKTVTTAKDIINDFYEKTAIFDVWEMIFFLNIIEHSIQRTVLQRIF